MLYLIGLWESVRDFIATGGDVLYVVAAALFFMWVGAMITDFVIDQPGLRAPA